MKWFGVDSDTPNDPKIRALMNHGARRSALHAQARMGGLFLVWCHIADHGSEPGRGVDADGAPLPLQEIADACYFESVEKLVEMMEFCAVRKHIDPVAWKERQEIMFPAMAKRADEYSRKKFAGKLDARPFGKSGMTRRQIFERDGYVCRWCTADLSGRLSETEVDHLVPKAQGGTDAPTNLVTACRRCSRSRRLQNPPSVLQTPQAAREPARASSVRTPQERAPDTPVCTVGSVDPVLSFPDHRERTVSTHTARARIVGRGVMAGTLPGDHLQCFGPCVRVCYPMRLAEEHARALGGDPNTAIDRVAEFRRRVIDALPPDQAVGDRPYDFWRAHFAAAFPSAAPATRPAARPSHTPADVDKYAGITKGLDRASSDE